LAGPPFVIIEVPSFAFLSV